MCFDQLWYATIQFARMEINLLKFTHMFGISTLAPNGKNDIITIYVMGLYTYIYIKIKEQGHSTFKPIWKKIGAFKIWSLTT